VEAHLASINRTPSEPVKEWIALALFALSSVSFAKLPAGTVEGLLKPENKDKLVDLLTDHVVVGKVPSKTAVTLDMPPAK